MITLVTTKHLRATNDSWRMYETYLKIKEENAYLYRAVDSAGNIRSVYKAKGQVTAWI